MTHQYNISGMTCSSCIAKVKSELLKTGGIITADVQLTAPQATISMQQHIPLQVLQSAIQKAGPYNITGAATVHSDITPESNKTWFATYKPVLLIFFYVTVIAIISSVTANQFHVDTAMRIFMAGFFLAFSFFKLLDISGFADSYSTYDIIAKKFRIWGFIYPFVEFFLGIAYALNVQPLLINTGTFFVMAISIIGVLQAVLNKQKIRCACLGAVFNLPMSSITIIEDALMIAMSSIMLLMLF
jgi:copper chaperone CopZ